MAPPRTLLRIGSAPNPPCSLAPALDAFRMVTLDRGGHMPASKKDVPTFEQLINPILRALHRLGGSASIRELVDGVVGDLGVSEELAGIPHGRGTWTELGYRSAWARNYLKNFGLIENSERGIWALTAKGRETQSVDARQLVRAVQQQHRETRGRRGEAPEKPAGPPD